jgi:hypothetical protein
MVDVLEFNRPTGSFRMVQTVPVAGCCFGIYDADLLPWWLAMHPPLAIGYSVQENQWMKIPMSISGMS